MRFFVKSYEKLRESLVKIRTSFPKKRRRRSGRWHKSYCFNGIPASVVVLYDRVCELFFFAVIDDGDDYKQIGNVYALCWGNEKKSETGKKCWNGE